MNAQGSHSYHLAKVAQLLKISRPLVLKMAKNGELPCARTPQGLRVEEKALKAWINDRLYPSSLANSRQKK